MLALSTTGAAAESESALLPAIILLVYPLATEELTLGILKMRAKMKAPPDGGDCWCADADNVDLMAGLVEDDELEAMEAFAKDVGKGKTSGASRARRRRRGRRCWGSRSLGRRRRRGRVWRQNGRRPGYASPTLSGAT